MTRPSEKRAATVAAKRAAFVSMAQLTGSWCRCVAAAKGPRKRRDMPSPYEAYGELKPKGSTPTWSEWWSSIARVTWSMTAVS